MYVFGYESESEVAQACLTVCDPMECSVPGSSIHDFSGKNTGVGFHFFFQEIFLTQGLNLGLPHCRQMFYPLSHQGCPLVIIYIYKCYVHASLLIIYTKHTRGGEIFLKHETDEISHDFKNNLFDVLSEQVTFL